MKSKQDKLVNLVKEIEEGFNKQIYQMKQLIGQYDQLDIQQQYQLLKAIIRLQKFIQSTAKPKMEQKNNNNIISIQEGTYQQFTEEDIEIMKQSIRKTTLLASLIHTFNEEISKEIIETNLQLNVNQKTREFIYIDGCYYYGYLLNGTQTGRGVSVYEQSFYNGYFSNNLCQIGTLVQYSGYEITVNRNYTIQGELESKGINKQPMDQIVQYWKRNIILQMIQLFPEMQQLIVETQEQTQALIQPEEINKLLQKYQINQQNIKFHKDGFYCGYIQKSKNKQSNIIREGFGAHFDFLKKTQAIGIWLKDTLVYGTFLQLDECYQIVGEIPNKVQHYLQVDEENIRDTPKLQMLNELINRWKLSQFN